MSGLFDTLTIAKRGLSVSQNQVNTTAHNIANTDTEGYTRQRAVATTTTPYGGNSKFDGCSVGQIGTGSQISSIERIRDSFEDYKVRTQTTQTSYYEVQDEYLEQAVNIFDETSDSGLQSALDDLSDAFQALSTSPTDSNKTVAVAKASTLATNINDRYTQLEDLNSSIQDELGDDVSKINALLDQISDLNEQISSITSDTQTPNDLMDTRDNYLDELSAYFGITVGSEDDNAIALSTTDMASSSVMGNLVTADATENCTRFSSVESVTVSASTVTIIYAQLGDEDNLVTTTVAADSAEAAEALKTSLEKSRILIADSDGNVDTSSADNLEASIFTASSGEVAGGVDAQTEIQSSMNKLDNFAAAIAYTVNAVQTASTTSTDDLVFVADGTDSDTGINAKNITINSDLDEDSTLLNCGVSDDSGDTDATRALAMANISSIAIDFSNVSLTSTTTRSEFLTDAGVTFEDTTTNLNLSGSSTGSTTEDYYGTITDDLNTAADEVGTSLTNAETQLTYYTNERTSTSGVSLDEETTNLIEYQHAYQANAKIISVIDELLDVVINGLMA